jgi:hypothetical protein
MHDDFMTAFGTKNGPKRSNRFMQTKSQMYQ